MRGIRLFAGLTASLLAAAPAVALDGAPPDESAPEPVTEAPAPEPADLREVPADLREVIDQLRERLDRLETANLSLSRPLHAFPLPVRLEFAGEAVPLGRWDVAERLEREFLLSLGNPAQVVLWLKRSARYFPYIERELARAGLPDDLKYVAVIESALLPGAYSHASALGIWQFIASTARRYGLAVTTGWDERRNPERSTAAALAYLRELRQRFAEWPLALAAYNTGETRLDQAMRHQGVSSYYQLALSDETERYVFRALAAKLILSAPERYGFEVPHEQRYRPHDADVIVIELRDRTAVAELARQAGSFYRELKALNPEIVDDWLGKGRYALRVPKGHGSALRAGLPGRTGSPAR